MNFSWCRWRRWDHRHEITYVLGGQQCFLKRRRKSGNWRSVHAYSMLTCLDRFDVFELDWAISQELNDCESGPALAAQRERPYTSSVKHAHTDAVPTQSSLIHSVGPCEFVRAHLDNEIPKNALVDRSIIGQHHLLKHTIFHHARTNKRC